MDTPTAPANADNGAEARWGAYGIKVGGPLAILAALMGGMFYVGWQDRQASLQVLREHIGAIEDELKLIRCAFMMPEEDRRKLAVYWEHEEQIRKYCRWLTYGDHREGGATVTPQKGRARDD